MSAKRGQARRRKAERAGRWAEWLAALYLQLSGHRILQRRYRTRAGEIDLIARRGKVLIFVEVKQRSQSDHAVDPVSARSEERIIRAGESFFSANPTYIEQDYALRYDIIIVTGLWRLRHQKDMFRGW